MKNKNDMSNYNQLFSAIESSELQKYPLISCCMKDGILYPKVYDKSPLKFVVALKEPYADWDEESAAPKDCDFDFFDIVRDLKRHYDVGLNKTWLKVAAIACSLKNNASYTESLSYDQVVEGLSCVAWINLSKTPWRTTTTMNAAYKKRAALWEPVVKEQLLQASPDIVFYGNTWDSSAVNPIEPKVPWSGDFCSDQKQYAYTSQSGKKFRILISRYRNTKKILVNGYHPEFGNSAEWQTSFIKEYLAALKTNR